MGTSKSMTTPRGGQWTDIKRDIRQYILGNSAVSPSKIVGSTIAAAGGLPVHSGPSSGTGGGGGGGGAVSRTESIRSIARAVSNLGGFGATLQNHNLNQALGSIGIADLRGRPAGEVISRIAEQLSNHVNGLQREVLRNAIQQAIFQAAELVDDLSYEDLEASLQSFLTDNGIEGLVELVLTQYVFDRVWLLLEDYVNLRDISPSDVSDVESAVEQVCRSNVNDIMQPYRTSNSLDDVDWFGSAGIRLAESAINALEQRLRNHSEGGV